MKIPSCFTIFLLASFIQISFALVCSDLSESQCNQLEKDGCIWSETFCSGSYSPSCVPPSCYYIDSSSQSTATPDGTPKEPLKTLSDGFTAISGKDGLLIIVNIWENTTAAVTRSHTISSNVTVKPLFEDTSCTIDFTQFKTFFGTALTIKNTLKFVRTKFNLKYQGLIGGVLVFSVSSGAGGLYFENVEVKNTSSVPEYMIALVRVTNSIFSMVNCKFTDSSVLFLSNSGSTTIWKNVYGNGQNMLRTSLTSAKILIMKDCFFTDLAHSPLFTIGSAVKMTVEDSIFDKIWGTSLRFFIFQTGSGFYGVPSTIRNTSFTNIAVQTSLLYLEGKKTSLSLVNVTMKNITQQPYIRGYDVYTANELSAPRGPCGSAVRRAQLYVESSNFSNIPSHCFGLRDTILTLKSSVFDNSQIATPEALIVREDISSLNDDSGVSWITIEGTPYSDQDTYRIFIQDCKFIKNGIMSKSGGAVRFKGIKSSQITITGSEFIGNRAYYGGAISSENAFVSILELENNLFVDNSAYHGGVIYKIDGSSGASVSILNNQFIGNKATKNGGALYLYWDSLLVLNTKFISNYAINGGSLYFINLDETEEKKFESSLKNVSFIENSASNAGGAMKLFFEYSQLNTEANIFENNYDSKQQAINQGRPLYYLLSFYDLLAMGEIARQEDLEDLVKDSQLTRLNFTVNTSESSTAEIKFKSGNELAQILQVQIFDSQNKVADYIDDEDIAVEMVAYQNNITNKPASLTSSPLKFKVSNGQFFAKSAIKMHGEPKTTATLQFSNVQGLSDFIQDSGLNRPFSLQVRFVDCEEGDIFDRHTRSCLACIRGSYSFGNPYQVSHCNQCPKNIDCLGGNQVGPQRGYWMENSRSLKAMKCPNPSACLGAHVNYEYFPNGKCLYPHQGNLCNQCAPKFAKFGSSTKCEDCKNTVEYYLKFALFLLLQVAVILGLFKLNEKQDANQTFYLNFIKIFINFVQINSLITHYHPEWSSLTNNFIHVINSFIPTNHDGFPIDCFISLALPNNQDLIFVKLVVTCFQPLIIWGFSILAYLSILLCSAERKDIKRNLKAALGSLFIITAFLVQPNIILTCLDLFSCQNLGSAGSFLKSDSGVECWTGSHLIWSFAVALPLLLIWAVLLPIVLYCKIKKCSSKWQPFFYQGLDKKRSYWEFLMLFFKTLVIILFTILTIIQTEIQVLSIFFVCISMTVLFLRLRPYGEPRLHYLKFFSLATLTLSSYVSFFSLTDNWMGTQMTICSVLLLVANCGLLTLPAFYIIKDYAKPRRLESHEVVVEDQPPTEAAKFSGTEEELPKQIQNQAVVNSDDGAQRNEDIGVCDELDQEIKIGKIVDHTRKESVDNYSIMQTSGSGLFSPLQSTSRLLLSPLPTSPKFQRQFLSSPTPKENVGEKGGLMQKSIKQKKINSMRINMKQFVFNELELKNKDTEKTVTETTTAQVTSGRRQEEVEPENPL